MRVEDCVNKINTHLNERAWEITRDQLTGTNEKCQEPLTDLSEVLSENEFGFLKQKANLKAVPMPKTLIKDHKKAHNQGRFPTCLVLPATNFTAGFPKLEYLGIKRIFNSNNVKCGTKTSSKQSTSKQNWKY